MSTASDDPDQLLLFAARYEGPWERLGWLLRGTGPLAGWCERRDTDWRRAWACRGTEPPPRWKRKGP
jgi:hypothetical protein